MATTFSRGFKVKLIGTGLEAGTWGTSTNENFKRVDQYLSGVATSFNVVSPNLPSTFSGNILNWCLGDTTDAWEDGSEGRYRFVNFTGTHGADVTVKICGNTSAIQNTNRVYWVRNSLGSSRKIVLDGGSGTDYTLQNGSTALIYSDASGNVGNILDDLQIGGIDFRNAASVITLKDSQANALVIEDDANGYDYIHFDTTPAAGANAEHVALGSTNVNTRIESDKVDLRGGAKTVHIVDNQAASLDIVEGYTGTPASYLKFDTTNSAEKLVVGKTLDIDTATVDLSTQATAFSIKDGEAAALTFGDSNGVMLTLDTNTEPEKIITASTTELEVLGTLDVDGAADFSGALTATGATVVHDLAVGDGSAIAVIQTNGDYGLQLETGSSPGSNILIQNGANGNVTIAPVGTGAVVVTGDSYVNLSSTVGTGGYGLFSNSGVLEVSNTNSDGWGQPYHAGMVNGQGGYFEATFDLDVSGNRNNGSASHGFSSIPRIIRCVLICESSSNGYAVGDEIDISSLASADTGDNVDPSGATYGADANDVFYSLAGTLRAFPKTGYTSDDHNPTVMSKLDWNLKIMAWK